MIYCYILIIVTVQYQIYCIQEAEAPYWHDFAAVADQINAYLVPRHTQATNNRGTFTSEIISDNQSVNGFTGKLEWKSDILPTFYIFCPFL